MRHLSGIVLAVVAALAIFFGGGWGYLRLLQVPTAHEPQASLPAGGGSLLHHHQVLFSLAALLAVGLLIGLLMAVPWVSPLATGLPGLALLGLTGLYLARVHQAVQLIPLRTRPYGLGFEALLFNGLLAAAGLAMVVPLFVDQRRHRGDRAGPLLQHAGVPDRAQHSSAEPVPARGEPVSAHPRAEPVLAVAGRVVGSAGTGPGLGAGQR
jgi:hypothetical protein